MKKRILADTLRQYVQGELSEEEARAFLVHLQSGKDRMLLQQLIQELMDDPVAPDLLQKPELLAVLDDTWDKLHRHINPSKTPHLWGWKRIVAVAATIVAAVCVGWWIVDHQNKTTTAQLALNIISPGKQSATLTLANGKKIHLHDIQDGEIVAEMGIKISKSRDGQLIYEVGQDVRAEVGQNTLSTTKGETYRIKLPDGTHVWLNAASSLTYPVRLAKQDRREVTLQGEAYFEVAKDRRHPFIVHTDNQQIEVLGTHFNVNSYTDESAVRTTLLEGRVEVSSSTHQKLQLVPGQQSSLTSNGVLKLQEVDTSPIVAWTNNEFMFDGDDIESVMRKIARWYDVDVIYQGKKTTEKFGGGISRFDHVQQVLNLLEKTGAVHFKIEGKTLYVLP